MEIWKRNLVILCFAQFLVMSAMTLIIPFLPLYLQQDMGVVDEKELHLWTGVIFGANFLSAFLFSPLWGNLADRHGRKIMLIRSGFGMAAVTMAMGFATSPLHLLILRFLNGTVSGFIPASITLVSTNTPKDKTGYALGLLHAGGVAGAICGPLLGGVMAEWIGFRYIFFVTGGLLFLTGVVVVLLVKEVNKPDKTIIKNTSMIEDFRVIIHTQPLPALFVSGFMIQFALFGTTPFVSVFVQELWQQQKNLSLLAGSAIAITGISTMIFSPFLGRWGDRFGAQRILFFCLVGAGLFFIPHALVTTVWQLLAIRFLLGLCIGGMLPSVNALIRKHAPAGMESRTYGYSNSGVFLGGMLGPAAGGLISGWLGIPSLFFIAAILLLFNALWVKNQLHPKPAKATPLPENDADRG
jgi:DHA1 family multidrug resistance protein-like MFS transporter